MKNEALLIPVVLAVAVVFIAGMYLVEENKIDKEDTTHGIVVVWDVDGKETTSWVKNGGTPSYKGVVEKAPDAQYTYEFTGWSPEITRVTSKTKYTAVFAKKINSYTVTWSVDGKCTSETLDYGTVPAFAGSTDKSADVRGSYAFSGWSPSITKVSGNVEYVAQYDITYNEFQVEFIGVSGEVLEIQMVKYGHDAVAPAESPSRHTRTHDYLLRAWNGITNVTEARQITPVFEEVPATMMTMYFSSSKDSMIQTSIVSISFNRNGFDLREYGYSDKLASAAGISPKITHLFVAAHEDAFGKEDVASNFVFSNSGWTKKFWGTTLGGADFMDMTYLMDGVMTDVHTTVGAVEGAYVKCNVHNWLVNGVTKFDRWQVSAGVNSDISLKVENVQVQGMPPVTYEGTSFYFSRQVVSNTEVSTLTKIGEAGEDGSLAFKFSEAGTYYVCVYRAPVVDESGYLADPFGAPVTWCIITVS